MKGILQEIFFIPLLHKIFGQKVLINCPQQHNPLAVLAATLHSFLYIIYLVKMYSLKNGVFLCYFNPFFSSEDFSSQYGIFFYLNTDLKTKELFIADIIYDTRN